MSDIAPTPTEPKDALTQDTQEAPKKPALISYLEGLAVPTHEDRAALAELRASLGQDFPYKALRHVLPRLPQGSNRFEEDDALLLAGLFALHPESGGWSLARALKKVMVERGSESIEGRFRALLSADRADLDAHLRHAITLVATEKLGLDWHDLWRTISGWDHPDNHARRAWARHFWAVERPETTDKSGTADTSPSEKTENTAEAPAASSHP
jgi:CRISPR system Cascade subunit CasB